MSGHVVCASGAALLMDHLEAVLPEAESAKIDIHVAGCPRCTAFVASYRATPRIVREAMAVAVPPHLEPSLIEFLRTHQP